VLLTGASGGIGNAIARALHGRGASLVLTGRRADALDSLRSELGERVEVVPADLAEMDQADALVERAAEVDVFVANAGLPAAGELDSFSEAEIDRALDVNLRVPIRMARALAPAMVDRGKGHLVFISSLSGKMAAAGGSIYSATKFGLRGFAFGLREELRGTGVGVTTVFPGFISEAGMWASTGIELPRGVGLRSPVQVADAVLKGIERDRAEIDVAPLALKLSCWFGSVAPSAAAALGRRIGSDRVSEQLAEAQRGKR
jgi:short-subunit dehydrogenase